MNTLSQPPKARRQKKNAETANTLAPVQARPPVPAPVMLPFSGYDELVSIAGIDFTIERALNIIGIVKFADFHGLTPALLAQKLAPTITITADTIAEQDWIGQAARLTAEAPTLPTTKTDETMPAVENKPTESRPVAEPVAKPQPVPAPVERDTGRKPASVETLVPKHKRPSPAPEDIAASGNGGTGKLDDAPSNLTLIIQDCQFTPFETQLKLNQPAVTMLRGEIHCKLSGARSLLATIDGSPLCAQVHAINELTGEHILLATQSEALLPAQANYRLLLEFVLPQRGRYQLQVIAFLLNSDPKIAFREGPRLRVEA